MEIGLVNPNTNAATTRMMLSIAQQATPAVTFIGLTAALGPKMILDGIALDASVGEVVRLARSTQGLDGLIVSAFGDPGVAQLSRESKLPVIGIGGAAARAADQRGGVFAVVTTTAKLVERINMLMQGQSQNAAYAGTFITAGDPRSLMDAPDNLDAALLVQIQRAALAGATQVIIGGGPLGMAAERLATRSPVPLINPISAAAREMGNLLAVNEGAQS